MSTQARPMLRVVGDPADDIRRAMADVGIRTPDPIVVNGEMCRFYIQGHKRGSKNGWCVAYGDYPANATFGDWTNPDEAHKWSAVGEEAMTPAERQEFARRMEETQRQRKEQRKEAREKAAKEARRVWLESDRADPEHQYLQDKGVGAHGLKQDGDALVVPARDATTTTLHTIQRIYPNGTKLFLPGGAVRGHFHRIGTIEDVVVIGEGYATVATVHEATGYPAVVAFDCSNLPRVAAAIREYHPEARILIAGDNDTETTGNPGRAAAEKAAAAVDGVALLPDGGGDWNDYAAKHGLEAVAEAFRYNEPSNARRWEEPQAEPVAEAFAGGVQVDNVNFTDRGSEKEEPLEWRNGDATQPKAATSTDVDTGAEAGTTTDNVLILDSADPLPAAKVFQGKYFKSADGLRTLQHQGGVFFAHNGGHYVEVDEPAIRAMLWRFAAGARQEFKGEQVPFKPTTAKVANILDATRAVANLPQKHQAPCWLGARKDDPDPRELAPMVNGILHVPTRQMLPATSRLFTHHSFSFPYDVKRSGAPVEWLAFLETLWPGDPESIQVLREIFGYLILPDTRQQKTFLLVGPKRSGKGTIGRVLTAMLGQHNVCAPTLGSLSGQFGLQPLIGKLLALVSDARLGAKADQSAIAERLLTVSGEDSVTIDRKYLPPWNGRLATRFMMLTNELPRIADTSGALASRFVVLTLERSFYGHEDPGLTNRLLKELPEIFAWALDGWERLTERGHFQQPAASADAIQELEDLGSPISAFLRDRCRVEAGATIAAAQLYDAWKSWCATEGRDHPGTAQTFGRDLRAAVPGLKNTNNRVGDSRMRFYEGVNLT